MSFSFPLFEYQTLPKREAPEGVLSKVDQTKAHMGSSPKQLIQTVSTRNLVMPLLYIYFEQTRLHTSVHFYVIVPVVGTAHVDHSTFFIARADPGRDMSGRTHVTKIACLPKVQGLRFRVLPVGGPVFDMDIHIYV